MTASGLLARLAIAAMRAAHVRHVIVCPGSRSAPLAYALGEDGGSSSADQMIEVHIRHDERVAAFTALGVGRDAPGPVAAGAVVTTSGTAVANLHPAVLEAHHAGVPLVVVTADRPPALRGTWANQTSELQAGLFGNAVRARLDLDDETASADPDAAWAALVGTLQAAYGDGPGRRPGPVHLNLGFTEPLVPAADEPLAQAAARPASVRMRADGGERGEWLEPGPRTLVVAGDGAGWQARWLAEAAGYPLLAEPSSGARTGPNLVQASRLLLDLPELADGVERVVVHGRPTLSRPVTRLLGRREVELVLVSPYDDWPNPGRPVRRVVGSLALRALEHSPKGWYRPDPDPWAQAWLDAGAAGRAALDSVLDAGGPTGLSGPLVARELVAAADGGEAIMAGSSNAIRDLDLAMPREHLVVANRGLAGIDGTLSTAIGLALARQAPVRALVGDLTFLHDANALLLEPGARRPDVQVVVLNDSGGGIFGLLEHGARAGEGPRQHATFERYFGTPHGADLASLCRAYGVDHVPVGDVDGLRCALQSPRAGLSVVEVALGPGYRAGLRDLHARIRTGVHAAARAAVG